MAKETCACCRKDVDRKDTQLCLVCNDCLAKIDQKKGGTSGREKKV